MFFRDAFFLSCVISLVAHVVAHRHFYTAAVYEHNRFGSLNDSERLIVERNLDYYITAALVAKSKGADIIVYPEYGIFPPADRDRLKLFLEALPDPRKSSANPCEQSREYSKSIILRTLSCIAKKNSIYVAANTGDMQNCKGDPDCPPDGFFHFNTNVVFNREGTLINKYHKEHLFYEFGMDVPKKQQNSTFQTDFGTFATFTSFDIHFGRMSEVAQWPTVDGVMLLSMFVEQVPQMTSIQLWQAWALGNNATLLASNIQIPGYFTVGSGIFYGERGALAYTFNPEGISKVVVARVPKRGYRSVSPNVSITAIKNNAIWDFKEDGHHVVAVCSRTLLNDTTDIHNEFRCLEENMTDYTFVQLTQPSGHVEACNNGVCCYLDYVAYGVNETFFLGVFNGTYHHFTRYSWFEQDCVLARCDSLGERPCATFPMKTNTIFRYVYLRSNMTTKMVYPSVVESGMRLIPKSDWYHAKHANEAIIYFNSKPGKKLMIVGFKGRSYDKDPAYIR